MAEVIRFYSVTEEYGGLLRQGWGRAVSTTTWPVTGWPACLRNVSSRSNTGCRRRRGT